MTLRQFGNPDESTLAKLGTLSIKIAIVPKNYPREKSFEEQGTTNENTIGDKFECLKDKTYLVFSGSHKER